MHTLHKKYLSPALLLTLLPAMFRFGPEGIRWFWSDVPLAVPALLLMAAAGFWALCFKPARRR